MIHKDTFKCYRCGACCWCIVKLDQDDIDRITSLGLSEKEFVDDQLSERKVLKRNGIDCIFLRDGPGGIKRCAIHENRPKVCQRYPFIDTNTLPDCQPRTDQIYPLQEAREILDKRGFI